MALADQFSTLFKKKPQEPIVDDGETIAQDPAGALSASSPYDSRGLDDSTVMVSTMEEPEEQALIADETFTVPLLGTRTGAQHQRILSILLGLSLVALAVLVYWTVSQTDRVAQQVGATGQSQRLAKSVSQALVGSPEAFPELKESTAALASNVRGLQSGSATVPALGEAHSADMAKIVPLVDRAEKNAATVMGQQETLTQVGAALRSVSRQSSDLLEVAETVSSLKLQQGAAATEISAAGRARKKPPRGPCVLTTRPARRSSPRIDSRNFRGSACAPARASVVTNVPCSASASCSIARTAYSVLAEISTRPFSPTAR